MQEKTRVRPSLDTADVLRVRQAEFPLASRCVYLNHAASSPLPKRSADAVRAYIACREQPFRLYQAGTPDYDLDPLRRKLASLLNCSRDHLGFVPSTSDGLALFANALDWQPGDNVVIPKGDFPGIFYAFSRAGARGLEIRSAPGPLREIDLASLLACADLHTRIIAVSHVHWTSGFRCDIAALGEACRTRGILLVVDAIQSIGARPFDLSQAPVDIVVAGAHKWLLGIPGTALIYVAPSVRDRLPPDRVGWLSVKTSVHEDPAIVWRDDGLRYLTGTPSEASLIALEQSVMLLADVGCDTIERSIRALMDYLISGLQRTRAIILSSLQPQHRSSILSFSMGRPETDELLCKELLERGIIVGIRGGGLRVAPHFYNTLDDVNSLLEVVRSFSTSQDRITRSKRPGIDGHRGDVP